MLKDNRAFGSFSVNDLKAAKEFYSETLGLEVEQDKMGLTLKITGGGNNVFVYEKPDHVPAGFTILNFLVEDIDQVVEELKNKGISCQEIDFGDSTRTDEKNILRGKKTGHGPDIAWFKDPAGNILSLLES